MLEYYLQLIWSGNNHSLNDFYGHLSIIVNKLSTILDYSKKVH